jgi:hypothetical protein
MHLLTSLKCQKTNEKDKQMPQKIPKGGKNKKKHIIYLNSETDKKCPNIFEEIWEGERFPLI